MFFYSGDYNESLKAYDEALQLDGGDFKAPLGKGQVLNALVRYDEALAVLIPEDQSLDAYAMGEKARALNGLCRYWEALRVFEPTPSDPAAELPCLVGEGKDAQRAGFIFASHRQCQPGLAHRLSAPGGMGGQELCPEGAGL